MIDWTKLWRGFGWAWAGLRYTARTQQNFRIHLAVGAAVLIAAALADLAPMRVAVLVMLICLVLSAELLNTAVEVVVDLVSPEHNRLAGIAKDVAAGAVLVCAVGAVIIGIIVFMG